jgi:peroxiredoxin
MALTESKTLAPGSRMPAFSLADPAGRVHDGASLYGPRGLLIAVTCNHCPYAQAIWPRLNRLAADALESGVRTVAINPNLNPAYPDDSPAEMARRIEEWHIPFPYLADEGQHVARALKAVCTPEFFLFDAARRLVYHGRFDDNWRDLNAVTRHELREAIDALVAGRPVPTDQHPALGCSIKWLD